MKVSVSIITYNHASYIERAIESVLAQRTDFDFEVIIGEDDSTDGTRDIVRRYGERYLDRIRLFLNDRRNVIYIDGRPTGRWNFINNLGHARGQYIALLEGDDYWTDPLKLQQQADYLDSHPECAFCFHDVEALYESGDRPPEIISPPGEKDFYTLEDVLAGNFIHTCSVMYRRGLFREFPPWFATVPVADWPLHALNAEHGAIGHIGKVMGVYRIHPGGIWSLQSEIRRFERTIRVYRTLDEHFNSRYRGIIGPKIRYYSFKIWEKKTGLLLSRLGLRGVVTAYRKLFYPGCFADRDTERP